MKIDPVTGLKPCGTCKVPKPPTTDYFPKNPMGRGGLRSQCRECGIERRRDWTANNKEHARATNLEYRIKNKQIVMFWACKDRAKSKSLPCTITENHIRIPNNCPICDCLLVDAREGLGKGRRYDNSPSVDMYDPTLGYIPGNIWVICDHCNRLKQNLTGEGHVAFGIKLIDAFKEYNEPN